MSAAAERPGRFEHAWSSLVSFQVWQGIGLLASAASVAIVSRLLGPPGYGRLTLILTIAGYLEVVSVNWTSNAVVRFGREELLRTATIRKVFWTRLALILPCVAAVVVVLLLAAPFVATVAGLPVGTIPAIAAIAVLLVFADHVDATLQASGHWRRLAVLTTIEKVTFIFVVVVIGLRAEGALLGIAIAASIAAQLARVVIGLYRVWRMGLVGSPSVDRETLAAVVRYSLPQTLTYTIGQLATVAEPLLIRWYLSVADVGVYQVAYQVMIFAIAALAPLSTMLLPAITSMRVENREDILVKLLSRLVPQLTFAASILIVILMGATPLFFVPLFGQAYAGGTGPLIILLAAVAFQVIVSFYSPLLAAYDLTRASAFMNTVGGIVMHLVPLFVFLAMWGTRGAAASWLAWYVFSAWFCLSIMSRRLSIRMLPTLAPPLIVLAAIPIMLIVSRPSLQWMLLAALLVVAIAVSRARAMFDRGDVVLLETVGVPRPIRTIAARVYAVLERPQAGQSS